jgi:hypothetical protein
MSSLYMACDYQIILLMHNFIPRGLKAYTKHNTMQNIKVKRKATTNKQQ